MAQTGGAGGGGVTGQDVVNEVRKFLGDPYVFGAAGPAAFDCSGLFYYALHRLGISGVPRTSEEQWAWVEHIKADQLQPGDLIFENFPGESSPGHVIIWAGDGKIIQAPRPGEQVQEIDWSPATAGGQVVGYGRIPHVAYSGIKGLGATSGSGGGGGGGGGSLLSLPSDVLGMFDNLDKLAQGAAFLFQPSSWVRIIAGVFGLFFAAAGIGFILKAA